MTIRQLGRAFALAAVLMPWALHAAEPVRPPVVEYRIHAALDPKTHVHPSENPFVFLA